MVSKRTGRPVGRPRKPRPPPRPRGRPAQSFRQDPDRYAVALLDAMLAKDEHRSLALGSERTCTLAAAAFLLQVLHTHNPKPALGLDGLAATLRAKLRRCRSAEEGHWRIVMASCFLLVLHGREESVPIILARAASVGELEFARRVMLPMRTAKIVRPAMPEFPANLISAHDTR